MGNLKAIRIEKGLTIIELGKRVGVSGASISRYENGKRKLSVEMAKKIAKVLEVEWPVLFD